LSYTQFSFKWSDGASNRNRNSGSDSDRNGASNSANSANSASSSADKARGGDLDQNKAITITLPSANASHSSTNKFIADLSVHHQVIVTNEGDVISDVVALAFVVSTPSSPPDTPLRKLFGFERFSSLAPGESRTAHFETTALTLGVVGIDGAKRLHPGAYRIECGSVTQGMAVAALELQGHVPLLLEINDWAAANA
jgi:hypothetical protein